MTQPGDLSVVVEGPQVELLVAVAPAGGKRNLDDDFDRRLPLPAHDVQHREVAAAEGGVDLLDRLDLVGLQAVAKR